MGFGDLKKPELRGFVYKTTLQTIGVSFAVAVVSGIIWKIGTNIKNSKLRDYNRNNGAEEHFFELQRKGYFDPGTSGWSS